MKLTDKLNGINGRLCIKAVNRKGEVINAYQWDNLITTNGYIAASECLAGVAGAAITSVSFGTDATAPQETDTAITDAEIGKIIQKTHVIYSIFVKDAEKQN